jgi:chromosome segregation ATPase
MAEEKPITEPAPKAGDPQPVPYDRFAEVNGKYKDTVKELEAQRKELAELQAKMTAKEQAALAEQGEFKKLYETERAEREKLSTVAEQHKAAMEKLSAVNKSRREAIPENLRELIPDFTDPMQEYEYLAKWEAKMPEIKLPGMPSAPRAGAPAAPQSEMKRIEDELASLAGKAGDDAGERRMQLQRERTFLLGGGIPGAGKKLPEK